MFMKYTVSHCKKNDTGSDPLRLIIKEHAVLCLVTQSCLTLCDPMDCSPPGSSLHGDSPGNNTEVGCHALLQGIFLCWQALAGGFFTTALPVIISGWNKVSMPQKIKFLHKTERKRLMRAYWERNFYAFLRLHSMNIVHFASWRCPTALIIIHISCPILLWLEFA